MQWQIEPMSRWPYPESSPRKRNPFRSSFNATLELLEIELAQLRVTGAVAVRVVAAEEIRRDYRKACRLHHPDSGGSPKAWTRLDAARQVLNGEGL